MNCPNCETPLTEVCVFERVRRFMTITAEETANGLTVLDGHVGKADDLYTDEVCCPHCDFTLTTVAVDYQPVEVDR